jgi:hypothetical protein
MENEITTPNVWNKTAEEMTVKDNLKVVVAVTVVSTVAWAGIYGTIIGGAYLYEKRQQKKAENKINTITK